MEAAADRGYNRLHARMIRISIAEAGKHAQLLTFDKGDVTLGRAADADLRLTGKGVSSRHCRIARVGESYTIEDLGSTNGFRTSTLEIVKTLK